MRREQTQSNERVTNPRHDEDRWIAIQALFVDDPKQAVEQAGALLRNELEQAMARLNAAAERVSKLPAGDATTEELRVALMRLRDTAHELHRARI